MDSHQGGRKGWWSWSLKRTYHICCANTTHISDSRYYYTAFAGSKAGQIPVAHKRPSTMNAGIWTAQKPNGFSVDIAHPYTVDEPARQTLLLFVQIARKHPWYAYTVSEFLDHICNLQTNIYTLILHCKCCMSRYQVTTVCNWATP